MEVIDVSDSDEEFLRGLPEDIWVHQLDGPRGDAGSEAVWRSGEGVNGANDFARRERSQVEVVDDEWAEDASSSRSARSVGAVRGPAEGGALCWRSDDGNRKSTSSLSHSARGHMAGASSVTMRLDSTWATPASITGSSSGASSPPIALIRGGAGVSAEDGYIDDEIDDSVLLAACSTVEENVQREGVVRGADAFVVSGKSACNPRATSVYVGGTAGSGSATGLNSTQGVGARGRQGVGAIGGLGGVSSMTAGVEHHSENRHGEKSSGKSSISISPYWSNTISSKTSGRVHDVVKNDSRSDQRTGSLFSFDRLHKRPKTLGTSQQIVSDRGISDGRVLETLSSNVSGDAEHPRSVEGRKTRKGGDIARSFNIGFAAGGSSAPVVSSYRGGQSSIATWHGDRPTSSMAGETTRCTVTGIDRGEEKDTGGNASCAIDGESRTFVQPSSFIVGREKQQNQVLRRSPLAPKGSSQKIETSTLDEAQSKRISRAPEFESVRGRDVVRRAGVEDLESWPDDDRTRVFAISSTSGKDIASSEKKDKRKGRRKTKWNGEKDITSSTSWADGSEKPLARPDTIAEIENDNPPAPDREACKVAIFPKVDGFEEREYQVNIARCALFQNTLVCLPTGLGKTLVAAVVLGNHLRWFPAAKVVFLVPTTTLAPQQLKACIQTGMMSPAEAASLTGQLGQSKRENVWKDKRAIFITAQTLCNDIEKSIVRAGDIRCIVIDEAHQARGEHAYVQAVRLVLSATKYCRVLALSATPGADFVHTQNLIAHLRISRLEVRHDGDEDVAPYVRQKLTELKRIDVGDRISKISELIKNVTTFVIDRLKALKLFKATTDSRTITRFAVAHAKERTLHTLGLNKFQKLEAIAFTNIAVYLFELRNVLRSYGVWAFQQAFERYFPQGTAEPLSKAKRTVMNSREFLLCHKELREVSVANIENHPKLAVLADLVLAHVRQHERLTAATGTGTRVMVFSHFRDSVIELHALLSKYSPTLKCLLVTGQGKGRGRSEKKAPEERLPGEFGLTRKEQKEAIQKFRSGDFNVMVATSVAEEGIDIGEVDLIVCFDVQKSSIRFVQRLGRTGRKRVGRCVILASGKEIRDHNEARRGGEVLVNEMRNCMGQFRFEHSARLLPLDMENPELKVTRIQPVTEIKDGKGENLRAPGRTQASKKRKRKVKAATARVSLGWKLRSVTDIVSECAQDVETPCVNVSHSNSTAFLVKISRQRKNTRTDCMSVDMSSASMNEERRGDGITETIHHSSGVEDVASIVDMDGKVSKRRRVTSETDAGLLDKWVREGERERQEARIKDAEKMIDAIVRRVTCAPLATPPRVTNTEWLASLPDIEPSHDRIPITPLLSFSEIQRAGDRVTNVLDALEVFDASPGHSDVMEVEPIPSVEECSLSPLNPTPEDVVVSPNSISPILPQRQRAIFSPALHAIPSRTSTGSSSSIILSQSPIKPGSPDGFLLTQESPVRKLSRLKRGLPQRSPIASKVTRVSAGQKRTRRVRSPAVSPRRMEAVRQFYDEEASCDSESDDDPSLVDTSLEGFIAPTGEISYDDDVVDCSQPEREMQSVYYRSLFDEEAQFFHPLNKLRERESGAK